MARFVSNRCHTPYWSHGPRVAVAYETCTGPPGSEGRYRRESPITDLVPP
jgi:hypothetical protein